MIWLFLALSAAQATSNNITSNTCGEVSVCPSDECQEIPSYFALFDALDSSATSLDECDGLCNVVRNLNSGLFVALGMQVIKLLFALCIFSMSITQVRRLKKERAEAGAFFLVLGIFSMATVMFESTAVVAAIGVAHAAEDLLESGCVNDESDAGQLVYQHLSDTGNTSNAAVAWTVLPYTISVISLVSCMLSCNSKANKLDQLPQTTHGAGHINEDLFNVRAIAPGYKPKSQADGVGFTLLVSGFNCIYVTAYLIWLSTGPSGHISYVMDSIESIGGDAWCYERCG